MLLMFYIIYETTNVVNGKKYRGAHTAPTEMDSYLGSGVALSRAIKKYGRCNFIRENIFFAFSEDDLYTVEHDVFVNQDWVNNRMSYNQAVGGRARRINTNVVPNDITVYQYDLHGALVATHNSFRDAACAVSSIIDYYKAFDLIWKCCDTSRQNQTAYGYYWSTTPIEAVREIRTVYKWTTTGQKVGQYSTSVEAAASVDGNSDRLLKVLRGSTRQQKFKNFLWSYENVPPACDSKTSSKDTSVICNETGELFVSISKAGARYHKAVPAIRDALYKGYKVRTSDGLRTFRLADTV